MYASLSFSEIGFYFVTWVSALLYSVYRLWLATDVLNPNRASSWAPGWSLTEAEEGGGSGDYEWQVWAPFVLYKAPWLASHLVGAELVRRNNIELLPVWYVLISAIFLLNWVGALATGTLLAQLVVVWALARLRHRVLLWAACAVLLVGFNSFDLGDLLPVAPRERYLLVVCLCWMLLRLLSFCLDALDEDPADEQPAPVSLVLCLAYCLYLPVLVLGPLLLHHRFQEGLKQPYRRWTLLRVVCAVGSLLRCVFWAFVIDISLHYIYFNTLVMVPRRVMALGNWALYGYGYCLGQFFMVKYHVIYGMGAAVARLEQIEAPHPPRCIARVHLYSYMWRHFDQGLYLFLLKYIYLPCRGTSQGYGRKLLASFACFAFIYIWHSTYLPILVWSLLNFVGVTLEGLGRLVGTLPVYRKWEDAALSPQGVRRFHAMLATPIFVLSALSNFYFLGSYAIGNVFLWRVLSDALQYNLVLLAAGYCCCQVSIEVCNWEERRALAAKQKAH